MQRSTGLYIEKTQHRRAHDPCETIVVVRGTPNELRIITRSGVAEHPSHHQVMFKGISHIRKRGVTFGETRSVEMRHKAVRAAHMPRG